MSKQITFGQALGFALTLFTLIIGSWINMQVNVTELTTKQEYMIRDQEQLSRHVREYEGNLSKELEEINEKLTQIQLDLKDKEDRQ